MTPHDQPPDPDAPPGPSAPSAARAPSRGPLLALVVGLLLVAVLVARPLVGAALDDREELLSTNTAVAVSTSARVVRAGDRTCQRGLYVPDGVRRVRVFPGYVGRRSPSIGVTLEVGDRIVARTRVARFVSDRPLTVAIGAVATGDDGVLCLRNAGPVDLSLAEARQQFGGEARAPVRVDLLGPGERSTLAMVPDALERAGRFKAGIVGWGTIVGLGAALLAAVAALVAVVLRGRGGGAS